MIQALVPVVSMIAGLLLWAFASNPKLGEVGKMLFFAGALALNIALASKQLHF